MKYTIRDIPEEVDLAARERAEREGVSLNEVLLRALYDFFTVEAKPAKKRDLSTIFDGEPLEPEVIEALEAQRRIDPRDWE